MPQLFNLEEARKNGYTDDEIATHLAKRHDFNLEAAMEKGYSATEISEYLSSVPFETKLEAAKSEIPTWGVESPNLYGAYGATKKLYTTVGKPLIEAGGLIGGGVAGTAAGPLGTVAGAGLGYAMTKKITDIIDRKISQLEGIKRRGKSVKAETIQSLYDIKEGLQTEMLGQSIGAGVKGGIEAITARGAKRMTPAVKYLQEQAKEEGIVLSPADITQSKSLGLAESVLEKAPGSADIIRDFRIQKQLQPLLERIETLRIEGANTKSRQAVGRKIWSEVTNFLQKQEGLKGERLNNIRTQIIAKLGTNEKLSILGLTAKDLIKAKSIRLGNRANQLYESIKNYVPNKEFEATNLNKTAKQLLIQKTKLAGQDKKMLAHLNWAAGEKKLPLSISKKLETLPPDIRQSILNDFAKSEPGLVKQQYSWETLQNFRQEMNALITKESQAIKPGMAGMRFQSTPEGYVYSRLRDAVSKDMERIAQETGGEAWRKYQIANAFYGKQANIFKNETIRKMTFANPEDVIDAAFKPNGITEVKMVKNALGFKGFEELKRGFTNKLLGVGKKDIFDPRFLKNKIAQYGDELLSEVYGESTLQELKKVAIEGLKLDIQKPGNSFLKQLSNQYPDVVVDSIIGAPESKLQSHTLLKNISIIKAVADKPTFDNLSNNLMTKLFQVNQETGLIRPEAFAKMVDKYGPRVLRIMFPKEKVDALQKLARIGHRITSAEKIAGNPSGTGQTLIAWGIFRMVMQKPIIGAAIAFTPKQLAKLYLSKPGMKLLTDGFKVSANSQKGIEIATKITAILNNEEEQER